MRVLCLSSSLSAESRSERLAALCVERLQAAGAEAELVRLKDHALPPFDNQDVFQSAAFQYLHRATASADALILASPVYNWGLCAELKRYIEAVGSTLPGAGLRGAFFDKVVTFVASAGLPHSYMATGPDMLSLMLDFKCIINPYTVYVHNRHWQGNELLPEASARLDKSLLVLTELTALLAARTYRSEWEI